MPDSRVIPERLPVFPGKDLALRFVIMKMASGGSFARLGGTLIEPLAHQELISLVNQLKEAEGNAPGGSFSINEHFKLLEV